MEWPASSWVIGAVDSGIGWNEPQDTIPDSFTNSPSAKVAKVISRTALGLPDKWGPVPVIITMIWESNVCPYTPKLWAIGEGYISIMPHPQKLWVEIT